jgi:hypothetical protein
METQMTILLMMVMVSPFLSIPVWSVGLTLAEWIYLSMVLYFSILHGLIFLMARWLTSPPRAVLLWLLISSITIEITVYLFSRELEVDLSRSDVDDRAGGVEERSLKDDRCIVFSFSYIQNHEVNGDIVILYLHHDISCYAFWKLDWLVHHLQLHICRVQEFVTE